MLVNHHKKHEDEATLTTDLIRGGSTFANAVDVIIQFSESLKEPGLRLMKITKNRSKSPNKLKCFGLKMDDNLWFENTGEVKEAWYMQNPKVNEKHWFGVPGGMSTRSISRPQPSTLS